MKLQPDRIRGKRILLVEDERAVRDALRVLLARDSHKVVEANNGAEAFALFLSEKFDLVMTDFEIPFVKGNELAAKIRRVVPRQPILMITAYDHKPGLTNPVDVVLNKPFDSARLLETIAQLLSQSVERASNLPTREWNRVGLASEDETICV